ncbi:MAG: RNA polymerase sigma-54 factor, partial [Prevotella sp.]|nr:RNA polymerase sigma-54 factor [Prevotella sp.]
MAQSQIQQQKQELRQQQSISAQQLLLSQLVELPLQQMTERIETELHDNPALEKKVSDDELAEWGTPDSTETGDGVEDFDTQREREERSDALDEALQNIGRDDEDLPVYQGGQQWFEGQEPFVLSEERTFYDQLMDQVGEMELDDRQRFVVEYIIQSLDDDGLLRTPLNDICEHLAIFNGIDIETSEIEQLLLKVQQMDPPGIGGRSLQECLLLQVERKKDSPQKVLM